MKRERGITLIALVITIIVLLILAGVSISLVVGDNGVLTQATNAVSKNREATALEDVQMAWASATSEYWTDWATDSSKNITNYRTKVKLDSYLVGKGHLEENPKYNDSTKEYTVKYRADDQNELYTFLITEEGNARKKIGVVLSDSELHILAGNTATLTASFVEMEEGTITWASSDTTSKITVSNAGVVSVASGTTAGTTATITATCNGKSDICKVIVSELLVKKNLGDYVNINIGYTDQMNSFDYKGNNIGKAWRILYKNEESGVVNLISTGHTFKYNNLSNSAHLSEIIMSRVNSQPIVLVSNAENGFTSCGFDDLNVKSLFSNSSLFSKISIPHYTYTTDPISVTAPIPSSVKVTGYDYWCGERFRRWWKLSSLYFFNWF